MKTVKAKIKDHVDPDEAAWTEEFDIGDSEDAKVSIGAIVDRFNNGLKEGESRRVLVEIVSDLPTKEIDCSTSEGFIKRAGNFKAKVSREAFNAMGHRWCHEHKDKVFRYYEGLIRKGGVTRFKNLVNESPYREDYQNLINSPIKSLYQKEN